MFHNDTARYLFSGHSFKTGIFAGHSCHVCIHEIRYLPLNSLNVVVIPNFMV